MVMRKYNRPCGMSCLYDIVNTWTTCMRYHWTIDILHRSCGNSPWDRPHHSSQFAQQALRSRSWLLGCSLWLLSDNELLAARLTPSNGVIMIAEEQSNLHRAEAKDWLSLHQSWISTAAQVWGCGARFAIRTECFLLKQLHHKEHSLYIFLGWSSP